MLTYQDFERAGNKEEFIMEAVAKHKSSAAWLTARDAECYYRQQNVEILRYVQYIYNLRGAKQEDIFAPNNKICSNFFNQFVNQEAQYLLSNGVSFGEARLKEHLGKRFDTKLQEGAISALVEGVSFGFWNVDHLEFFRLTEFAPLWDERTGKLRAGIRFWRIDEDKPLWLMLYEVDGVTEYRSVDGKSLEQMGEKTAYKRKVAVDKTGETLIGTENYPGLPLVPLYGNKQRLSELNGCKNSIDLYDRILSGFGNDFDRNQVIYWVVKNCGGMNDSDLMALQAKLKLLNIIDVDTSEGGGDIEPHVIDVPYAARQTMLDILEKRLYKDYGALDVRALSAAATATEIRAAYLPLDEKADSLEYCIIDFIENLLALQGLEGTAKFKRSRLINELEQTQAVMMAANYLDEETLLNLLPFVDDDTAADILEKKAEEDENKFARDEVGQTIGFQPGITS